MSKRLFYIALTIIWNLSVLTTTFGIGYKYGIGDAIAFFSLFILCEFVILLLIFVVSLTINNDIEPDTFCHFLVGFFTFGRKRIYYSDLGYFYIRQRGNYIIVSKQDWFSTKKLFETRVYDHNNIEDIRKEIKSELEEIYKEELEKLRKKEMINNWDGYIDIVSKRDDIINKIIK